MANIIELIIRTVDQSSGPLRNVASSLVNLRTVAAGVGAALGAAKIKDFLVSSFQAADQLSDAAKRAGVAVDVFSRLEYVATQNDIAFGEFTTALKFTNKSISDFAAGVKGPAADAFKFLEISVKDLQGLTVDKQLGIIADQFRRIKDPADQTRTAIDLFGRSGDALIPLLNQGSAGIKELTAEADRLGITMSKQSAAGVDALDSAIKKLKATLSGFGKRIVGNIALATVGADDPLIELERRAQFINQRINAIYTGAGGGIIGPGARKDLESLNAELQETERQIAKIQNASKGPDSDFLPPRKKEREEYKAFFRDINPQIQSAFDRSSEFLGKMTEAREATMTTAQRAAAEWAKFNEQIKEAGISAEDAAARTKEKLDEMLQEIDTNDLKRLRLAEPLTEAEKQVKRFTDAFKDGLENAAERGKFSVKELVRFIIAQLVKQELFKAIDNIGAALNAALSAKGSGGGGGGGFWAGLVNAGASFFGFRAGGGNFSGLTMVGENGPELVGGAGKVWNQQQLKAAGMGGGGTFNYAPVSPITINGAGGDANQTALLVEGRIKQNNTKQMQEIQRMLERNGFGRMR